MRPRLVQVLLWLYPPSWRTRYGAEFACLLKQMPCNFTALLDIVISAISERITSLMEYTMLHPAQRALSVLFIAWLMAVAAGINLYASVDDNPLAAMMRNHPSFMNSWVVIEAGSILGLTAAVIAGAPLVLALFRRIPGELRRQLQIRLLILSGAVTMLLIWLGAVLIMTGGKWLPVPWAVTGDWTASPNWPPLVTRWIFGIITLILLIATSAAAAVILRQIIRLVATSAILRKSIIGRISADVLAASLLLMAVGAGLWGFFADQYAHAIFHARFGGLLSLTTFSSWLLSLVLFATAAAIGIHSARQYSDGSGA